MSLNNPRLKKVLIIILVVLMVVLVSTVYAINKKAKTKNQEAPVPAEQQKTTNQEEVLNNIKQRNEEKNKESVNQQPITQEQAVQNVENRIDSQTVQNTAPMTDEDFQNLIKINGVPKK